MVFGEESTPIAVIRMVVVGAFLTIIPLSLFTQKALRFHLQKYISSHFWPYDITNRLSNTLHVDTYQKEFKSIARVLDALVDSVIILIVLSISFLYS